MTDWHHFWQNYRLVDITGDERLLFQVGKTVHGEVIDKLHFRILIEEIIDVLEINENDNILDLCCGNGVLTFELSRYAKYVLGIDFSKPFIENALKYKKNKNIDYLLSDVKELRKSLNNLKEKRFNKILLYDALAYFDEKELDALLKTVLQITVGKIKILLASVLDKDRKWSFFNTIGRKFFYLINIKILGRTKGLGTWWSRSTIESICKANNLRCRFLTQNKSLYTSHYRFNVLIEN